MSTGSNKRSVIVGIFICLGIIIFLVGVFTLGGQQKTFSASISVNALFNDVSGLQQGNNVWFSGVKIGTVKKISFFGTSQVKVLMHIDKKAQEFIRRDAKAKISSDGLIGNKIIVVYGGTQTAPAIDNNDTLDVQNSLSTEDIMATLQKNNENLIAITSDFKIVSKRLADGEGTLGALMSDKTLFKNLQATVANLQTAARNSEKLTAGIALYTAKLQSPGSLAGGLVNDTVIMKNLKSAAGELQQAAGSANAFTEQLKTVGTQLNNRNNTLGLLLYDEKTATRLRNTLDNLNTGSLKLNDDLEAAQHNFLLRGFFKKKAKQDAKNAALVVDTSINK
jgi:phospholipid/cholesterol/gamma-HCH transport system substrate-binding protein